MNKKTPSFLKDEADEVLGLTETTATLFKTLLPEFVNSTSSGCFRISNESPRFAVTIKLETKKGGNKG